jgi:RNA polymerase sigma-70 factor (family 1)
MSDWNIIRKINEGDDKAFRLLYELYFHKVLNYAQKFVHCQEDAREIAQDVFMGLWAKKTFLDPNQSISGLIFRMTKCMSIDWLRKQANKSRHINISSIPEQGARTLEEEILGAELNNVYNEILEKLPPKRKLIFQLSRDKNMTYNEIARELGLSPKTVEAQIRLALKQIRTGITNYSSSLIVAIIFLQAIR